MKKYIFTKYGYRKNQMHLMDIVKDSDPDYDVSDIFLIDFYSDDGETISVEAEDIEEAVYAANRWFGTCVTAENIMADYEGIYDPYTYVYIPAPVKLWRKEDGKLTKRSKKYYSRKRRECYTPWSPVFNYVEFTGCGYSF